MGSEMCIRDRAYKIWISQVEIYDNDSEGLINAIINASDNMVVEVNLKQLFFTEQSWDEFSASVKDAIKLINSND